MSTPPDPPSPVERRLATILVADVFGYSRMMGEDEERTVRTLRGHRAVFDDLLRTYRGRVFNTAGDAILAEFPSAVDAVRCATEIQSALRTRNEQMPEAQRMWFRIGINLGDVIVQDGDLLGDGVNIAARIEAASEPGGVCISGSVYDQIQNKLSLTFRPLPERSFKNIAQPVRTFALNGDAPPVARPAARAWPPSRAAIAAGLAAAVVLAGAAWWLWRDHDAHQAEAAKNAAEAAHKATEQAQAAAAAQKEAKLAAELLAAKEALAQSEAAKAAAEDAQREAKLAAELRAAKDALQKSTAAADKGAPAATPASAAAAPHAIDRYDGLYTGKLCKTIRDGSLRCWTVNLTAQHGVLTASWANRSSAARAHATGRIADDGSASLALDAFDATGAPVKGKMTGRWNDNALTFAGVWDDGTTANATLARAPEAAATAQGPRAARAAARAERAQQRN
ncbi:MAG: adenylate/guanylate cyclase domain-containing protein [Burkholderiales bacterium]